ncbi:zinc finger protein ichor [Leptinotarsa decemlineata]|uniref:zinc finger protein ichor n=1 Tax=Leptinotarsa decemlineata TaxID=7539 RepID=UPI003D306B6D
MKIMKYPNVSQSASMAVNDGSHMDEVDPLFISSCWNSNSSLHNEFIDTHKLIMDGHISNLGSDKLLLESSLSQDDSEMESKDTIEALDNLLLNSHSMNPSLTEMKPLPPFTGYTANLSINGIQGHHYHSISQRNLEENNNTYNSYNEQNIVSSSTCNISADSADDQDTKNFFSSDDYADCVDPDSVSSIKYEDCSHPSVDSATHVKTEMAEYDISTIDFAAIIGSAIADTTVPSNNPESEDATGSRDSWMDLDAFIEGACVDESKGVIIAQDGLSEFVIPCSSEYKVQQVAEYAKIQPQQGGSTLQSLLTHGYMPLLQNRLQNGPPIKQEVPSSTNYGNDMITTSSPPANVVSTTDNLLVTVNGRFLPQYLHSLGDDQRVRSPDMLGQNYPHTTTTSSSSRKSRCNRKKHQPSSSSNVFQVDQTLGLLGKEKPVHRCTICNRGFLNKSNIKVHLRTHTGEKPFRCETCAKAFRQKAHLLKHQQIHKRIGRD